MSNFDAALTVVCSRAIEGTYSNDPHDPGNWTGGRAGVGIFKGSKYGISAKAHPDLDIINLTLEEAKTIYRREYWDACACDGMPFDRALCVFDSAVNQGPAYARTLPADPIDIMMQRVFHYLENDNFNRFGKGWIRRLFTILKAAQKEPA